MGDAGYAKAFNCFRQCSSKSSIVISKTTANSLPVILPTNLPKRLNS